MSILKPLNFVQFWKILFLSITFLVLNYLLSVDEIFYFIFFLAFMLVDKKVWGNSSTSVFVCELIFYSCFLLGLFILYFCHSTMTWDRVYSLITSTFELLYTSCVWIYSSSMLESFLLYFHGIICFIWFLSLLLLQLFTLGVGLLNVSQTPRKYHACF